MSRPLLLIDIDGVLNPYVTAGHPIAGMYEKHSIDGLAVLLNASHGQWLRELATTYDLVWASSWEHDSNPLIGQAIGAPANMPFLTFTDRDDTDWLWKLPAVQRFVAHDRAVAWLDDDHGQGADEWAAHRSAPTLLVRTDGRIGWTKAEFDVLVRFAAGLLDR